MSTSFVRYIDLPRKVLEYLNSADFLSRAQLGAIGDTKWRSPITATIAPPEGAAEISRETSSEQLAKVGFDDAYGLTAEGRLLEHLIALFSPQG